MSYRLGLVAVVGTAVLFIACSASKGSNFFEDTSTSSTSGTAGHGGSSSTSTGDGGIIINTGGSGGHSSSGNICDATPDEDKDQDGFSINQNDCNDCDANVNPAAIEAPTDPDDPEAQPADENCNGENDEPILPCDDGIALTDGDPMNGARAIDICQQINTHNFGIISASYVRANGTPVGANAMVGIMENFGPNVPARMGSRMLAMSSGYARLPGQPNACGQNSCQNGLTGTAPPGFPQDTPGCAGGMDIYDDVGLELQIRAPSNADGFSYDFTFYSFEYPEWVCTTFNDQYIALMNPPPVGSMNGNISFDNQSNPVSVNIAFFEVCGGCPQGTAALAGTGFDGSWGDDAGATGWLITTAPVEGGQDFSIRFAIWDTGDMAWDSTVVIDNFTWLANAGTVTTGTIPVPR